MLRQCPSEWELRCALRRTSSEGKASAAVEYQSRCQSPREDSIPKVDATTSGRRRIQRQLAARDQRRR